MKQHLIELFLDYFNNWLTPLAFAEYLGLSESDTRCLIEMGRNYHEMNVTRESK